MESSQLPTCLFHDLPEINSALFERQALFLKVTAFHFSHLNYITRVCSHQNLLLNYIPWKDSI